MQVMKPTVASNGCKKAKNIRKFIMQVVYSWAPITAV
jgi:hypothetical protein